MLWSITLNLIICITDKDVCKSAINILVGKHIHWPKLHILNVHCTDLKPFFLKTAITLVKLQMNNYIERSYRDVIVVTKIAIRRIRV